MSKKRSGLGKGVDALFSAEGNTSAKRSCEDEGTNSRIESKSYMSDVGSSEVEDNSSLLEGISYNQKIMEIAIREADKNPRITLWSPVSAAMLKYLRKTIPEFSISEEASKLLEEAIITKYPELYKTFENEK